TPQAAADRVRRLEQSGVIQGYAAVVDPDAVGIHMLAFVAVSLERPRNREQFLSRVASLSEVQECHHISGDFDYLLKIRCRNTVDLERLIGEEIKGLGGVGASRTIVALRTVKETTILPLVTGPVQG
ncbi:MAG: Lrp/AsnC family transcriptional regulator, partial [Gemmatimonadota bacterium]|nr:Lrp/AsnC family transcriptional regulator [Gemmatimonadota bacterium]